MMSPTGKSDQQMSDLRTKAEEYLQRFRNEIGSDEQTGVANKLIHEMQVYQVELEIQNDELKKARDIAEDLSDERQELIARIPGIVWELDLKTFRFTFVSDQVEIMLGCTARQWCEGVDFWKNLIHPEDHERVVRFLRTGVFEKQQANIEYRMLNAAGQTVWVKDVISVIFAAGKPQRFCGVITDISDRKHQEFALQAKTLELEQLNQKFNLVTDNIPDIITLFSNDRRLSWINKAGRNLVSGQENTSGCFLTKMFLSDDLPCTEIHVVECFETGKNVEWTYHDEHSHVFKVRGFPVFADTGEVDQVCVVAQDITLVLQGKAHIVRTGMLASLGELAAGVAHEINNPINGIINYGQILLMETAGNEKLQELGQRIIKDGDRISKIVSTLLEYTRNREDMNEPNKLEEIVDSTLLLVNSQFLKDGITIDSDLHESTSEVLCNPYQIQQVLLNLLSNARYALNQKYPEPCLEKRILISTGRDAQDRAWIEVYDQGIGIQPADLERCQRSFFTTKPDGDGFGMGLSVCRDIMKTHHGELKIESAAGEWTRVRVLFAQEAVH